MMRPRALRDGRPIWLAQANRRARYPVMSGHRQTTVAVVGGGLTGALVAHAFASAGIATTVLEADDVGRGSTSASSALLLQEPDLNLRELRRRYGSRASRRIWQLSRESVGGLIALLRRLRIPCGLERRDAIYWATDAAAADHLRREFELRRRFGFEGAWLSPAGLRQATGIAGAGAIRSAGNAQCDPYRACLGVMRAAARRGAAIFERSRVRRIDVTSGGVRLRTATGIVDASRVVIATGYATAQFRPLAGRFRMYRTYVVSTAPAGAAARRHLGLSDVMLWDTQRPYHYARWSAGHRLLLGGGDRRLRPGARRSHLHTAARGLREYFESRLPALARLDTEAAWEGLFAMTPDSLPYVGPHRSYPKHWFALGYGGNGMTFGFLAARLLLERWRGVASDDHRLFEFSRVRRSWRRGRPAPKTRASS